MTLQTLDVLRILLAQSPAENYGSRVARCCGLTTGTVYPILARLEDAGWIVSERENIDESVEGRRRRRLYQFTSDGEVRAHAALLEVRQKLTPPTR